MRSKDRIDGFMSTMQGYWEKYFVDFRFGQLMLNFLGWGYEKHGDPFFWEDDKFIQYFEEYIKTGNSPFYKNDSK